MVDSRSSPGCSYTLSKFQPSFLCAPESKQQKSLHSPYCFPCRGHYAFAGRFCHQETPEEQTSGSGISWEKFPVDICVSGSILTSEGDDDCSILTFHITLKKKTHGKRNWKRVKRYVISLYYIQMSCTQVWLLRNLYANKAVFPSWVFKKTKLSVQGSHCGSFILQYCILLLDKI